jgi:hypothetical protein
MSAIGAKRTFTKRWSAFLALLANNGSLALDFGREQSVAAGDY